MPVLITTAQNNTQGIHAYITPDGVPLIDTTTTRGPYLARAVQSVAVGMREMDLTVEEATELRRRLDHPAAGPARPPRDLPATDA